MGLRVDTLGEVVYTYLVSTFFFKAFVAILFGLPCGLSSKESAYNAGEAGSIPWRRKWQPTPVFLPRKSRGQRSLVGYTSWSRKELDMTEQLSMHATILLNDLCVNALRWVEGI